VTILLVRHALALPRKKWDGDDDDRPLTARGFRQAAGIVDQLSDHRIDVVYSSPALRCTDTVKPLARSQKVRINRVKALAEGRGTRALKLVDRAPCVVLCAHGDNLPELLLALAGHLDDVPTDPPFAKGSTWVLTRKPGAGGKVRTAAYLPPPA
jgi:phosphohistidine phosphatase SixA